MPQAIPSTEESARPSGMSKSEWFLLIVLVISVFINYVDRGNLSMAAPLIEKELTLSPLQVGELLSAFFWTYSLFQLCGAAGWLADRFPVGTVFVTGFIAWTGATVATGFLSGFKAIYFMRLVLGVGESVSYPCYSKIFASSLPQHHRGRANALLDAGTKLGPALGGFLASLLLVRLGWRMFFIALGLGGLLVLIPWTRLHINDVSPPAEHHSSANIMDLLTYPRAWGVFFGHFCGNYFFYFLLTWAPVYLVKERNISIQHMANLVSFTFLAVASTTVVAGWVSDQLIVRGRTATAVRKTIVVAGLGIASVLFLPVAFLQDRLLSIAFLLAASIAYGVYASNHWAISQILAGPIMAGRWSSVQNGIANLAGVVAPWLAGLSVQTTGSSKSAFLVSAVVTLMGAFGWYFSLDRVETVDWARIHRDPDPGLREA